jgi:hypothetical protein
MQRSRDYLRSADTSWTINWLLEHGPSTESSMMYEAMEASDNFKDAAHVIANLLCLWTVKKLWRKPVGIHPGSGEMSFLYGIRGVHKRTDP